MDLFKVDFGLTVWMFISFVILLFILWKFAWPAILKGVDQRADLIDKGVEYAQNAKEQLDNAKEESRKYVAEARHQQADTPVYYIDPKPAPVPRNVTVIPLPATKGVERLAELLTGK